MNQDFIEPVQSGDINYSKILYTILSRWYWIAICVSITFSLAWVYLSVVHPRYSSTASIMLTEQKSDVAKILSGNAPANTNDYESYNLTQSATFIIRSDAFLSKAVSRLNYRYSFYVKQGWSLEELYPESPFTIKIVKQDSTSFYSGLFTITKNDGGKFSLGYDEGSGNQNRTYHYGDTIHAHGLIFSILNSYAVSGIQYYFRFHTKESLIARVANNLSVDPQNLNILSLTETDFNPYFAANSLNAMTAEYIIYESALRNQSAIQRLKFIDSQLDTLGRKVNEISSSLDSVKKKNNITDNLPMKLQGDIARLAQLETQRASLDLDAMNITQFEQQARSNGSKLTINFGLEGDLGAMLSSLISQYNTKVTDREKLLETYKANSDPVKLDDKQLADIRNAIFNTIQSMKDRNLQRQRYFDDKIAVARADLEDIPAQAKDFVKLQTEYEINRKIYTNFTEERYKSQIELAALAPTASIIYPAAPSGLPISPISKRIYLMALAGGVGAGLFLILLARVLNRRLQDIGAVLIQTTIPIMGLIRKAGRRNYNSSNMQIAFQDAPDSLFAESVRTFRNAMLFILQKERGKVICISSQLSGEGRSFITLNLACSLVQLDKRVVIIDADLRKPSLEKDLSSDEMGLSAYLINYKSMLGIVKHTGVKNLDIIPSGISPANPSELLQNQKMKDLISYLRNIYDYVVIDTSPSGIFADAIPLMEKADLNLYVLKGGISGYEALPVLEKMISEYHLNNFYIVLNAFKRNPLYQPFAEGINTDIYFNTNYTGYTRKYTTGSDDLKWEHLNKGAH